MAEPTTRSLAGPPGAASEVPVAPGPAPVTTHSRHRRRRRRRVAAVTGVVVLVAALGATATLTRHLWATAEAWEDRAGRYQGEAHDLGTELATERADLAGTRAELEAVREQLAVAHGRIVALADEKARLGDDNEVQRRLVDYQERVSDAAGTVALALDQCVQGQQQLIAVLALLPPIPDPDAPRTPTPTPTPAPEPDPDAPTAEDLEALRGEVDLLCQAATEANIDLQLELAR